MDVSYYEACVLARVGSGNGLTLVDFHKRAWSLFSTPADSGLTDRPFVFRFDPYAGARSLLTLRSDREFPGATRRQISIEPGRSVTFDLNWIPVRRQNNRGYTPPESEWPVLVSRLCERAGVTLAEPPDVQMVCTLPFDARMQRRAQKLPIATCRILGQIADEHAFVQSYLDGLGRKKGYGMGMIRVTPDSELNSRSAA